MTDQTDNGKFIPRSRLEGMKGRREAYIGDMHDALIRIEAKQKDYSTRLSTIEDKLNTQLEIVAHNTTAMSRSLEAIQLTNSKLVDVITSRNSVPTTVMLVVIGLLSTIFLIRELSMTGGSAKLSLRGVDIQSQPSK